MSYVGVILDKSIFLDYRNERLLTEKDMNHGIQRSTKNMIKRRITLYLLPRGMSESNIDGL